MLALITATTDLGRAQHCIQSWGPVDCLVVVENGRYQKGVEIQSPSAVERLHLPEFAGSVHAFRVGVDWVLDHTEADILACLHDDVVITQTHWVGRVERLFKDPTIGLAGFGGAIALGADDLYKTPYNPMQLARQGFRSNLTDAEVHGMRSLLPEQVACLDGFSQIGRRAFYNGTALDGTIHPRPWSVLDDLGIIHHAYDGMLGCLAARYHWETWYVPIACHHYGGRTAVSDTGYQAWAQSKGGDQAFWQEAHRIWYDQFRDVLPLRIY